MFETDLAACRTMLRGGSRSFFAAALLLPGRVHRPATALYAFCRVADDLIDGSADAQPALAILHERLDLIYAGRPAPEPADRALAHVVAEHRLPRMLLDQLLEGFAWDAEGRRYEDLPALHAYAARVAGTVGAAMAVLMGAREAASLGARLRPRRCHAAHQHRARRRRGCAGGAPLSAVELDARRRARP